MEAPTKDEVYEALTAAFRVRSSGPGLVEIRRAGDEAILMFRWPPEDRLFGVPVSLTRIDRRLDWDRPAHDLAEWLESVDLWLMEAVEKAGRVGPMSERVAVGEERPEPPAPADAEAIRHCWVVDDQGRLPGLFLEGKRVDDAWRGRVVRPVRESGGWLVVEDWVPGERLRPAE